MQDNHLVIFISYFHTKILVLQVGWCDSFACDSKGLSFRVPNEAMWGGFSDKRYLRKNTLIHLKNMIYSLNVFAV